MIADLTKSGSLTKRAAARFNPLGRELVFTAKELREAFEHALAAAGGSLGTWVVLNAVSDEGIVSQSVLASHANVDGATITHHIDRLEKLGLVRREVDPTDRRVRRVSPTVEGVRLHRRMLAKARAFETTALAGLDESDKAELRRMLTVIRSNLRVEDKRS